MKTFLIIDTSSYIHRSYHGYREVYPLKNKDGKPIWVSYGLIKKFHELIDYYKPDFIASCEDTRDNSFLRRKIYPGYKSTRANNGGKPNNDDLNIQFSDAIQAIQSMGITQISANGYEADDVIAMLVEKFKNEQVKIIIVTGDKDLAQLVDSKNLVEVHLNNGKGTGKLKYEELITEDDVVAKYGVIPSRIPDLFGLIGDKSDCIPGVKGMQVRIATQLLDDKHFSSLEMLYNNIDSLRDEYPGMTASSLKALLLSEKDMAFISKTLASPLPLVLPYTLGSFIRKDNPIQILQFMKSHGLENLNSKIGYPFTLEEAQRYMAIMYLLVACNNSYYRTGVSSLSDKEFDDMLEELKEMEKTMNYRHPESPTQHVGSDKNNFGNTVPHEYPMLSLDNSYAPEELYKWMQAIQDQYTFPVEFTVEWKWDGNSLSLVYKKGILDLALSRGDGTYGGDVTINAKELAHVPLRLKNFTEDATIRGEVMISKPNFDLINRDRERIGLPKFANPRNAASVISTGKNPKEIKERMMEFKAFKLMNSDESNKEDMLTMSEWGFSTSDIIETITSDLDTVMNMISKYDRLRHGNVFPTDGLVISVINKQVRSDLGETTKFPRWSKAYKFNPEGGITSLLDVRWQVGRKGTITPVAIIEPVTVSGSTISKASLHNIDRLMEKNLHYGDMILVEKAAEIIPQVIRVVSTHEENPEIKIPTACPCCGGRLERDGVALKCINTECPDRVKAYLEHIASKDILDLKDFGPSVIETLYQKGVRDITGLFDLRTYDGFENIEGYGETSKANLVESVENIITNGLDLYRFIASLGIPLVGKTIGKKLSAMNDIDTFLENPIFTNSQVGDKARMNIMSYLNNPDNRMKIQKLLSVVPIVNTMNVYKTSKLAGKSFCISGSLPVTKDKIEKVVRENAGAMLSGVSANLSYLICEDLANKKPQRAMQLGVPVISYKEFLELLK